MSAKTKQKKSAPLTPTGTPTRPAPVKKGQIDLYFWSMALVVLVVSLIHLRLAGIPLERDEGEYAYMGSLILDGLAPYKEAYNMKLPGTYFMYALMMGIFGKTITGIHIGLLLVNATTMMVLFLGLRKLFTPAIAFFSASVYGLMAMSPAMLGFAAHATHFVSLFLALGIFFFAKFHGQAKEKMLFFTGLMLGLSFLMKQQAVFFIVFGGLMVILWAVQKKPIALKPLIRQTLVYSAGVLIPYILTVAILMLAGAFDKFWFWTVEYASKYASGVPFKDGKTLFNMSFTPMWKEFGLLWILSFAGFILVFFTNLSWKQKLFVLGLGIFAFLTVCPGFYFRQHYFISYLPAVGLTAAMSLHAAAGFLEKTLKAKTLAFILPTAFVLIAIAALSKNKEYYFQSEPDEISKTYYGTNPFVESKEIARFLQENTNPDDKIAVVGSEPQIYVYADRQAATGYLYTYGLVENHAYNATMQNEMIAEIEKAKPRYIVFCNISFSWLYHAGAPMKIFEWTQQYTGQNYEVAGIADQASAFQTIYKWNDEAKTYQPKGQEFIMIYKRK